MKDIYRIIYDSIQYGRHKGKWKFFLWATMLLLTFTTTYFLILPAITIEEDKAEEIALVVESSSTTGSEETSSSSVEQSSKTETSSSSVETEQVTVTTGGEYLEDTLYDKTEAYTVSVRVTKDARIPKSATLKVEELKEEAQDFNDYKDQVENQIDTKIKSLKLYDITIIVDGQEVEPASAVQVEISYSQPIESRDEEVKIVHFKDDGQIEVLRSKDTEETKNARSDIAFKTDSFSIYAIVQGDVTVPRATYHFENADGTDYTFLTSSGKAVHEQVLKNGESLKGVGIPIVSSNQHFNGWYLYDKTTGRFGDRIEFDVPIPVTETKDIYVRPSYGKIAYVTLYDSPDGGAILDRHEFVLNSNGDGQIDLTTHDVEAPTSDLSFAGWSLTPHGAIIDAELAKNYPITGNISLYPVFKQAKKIEFFTGDLASGATYIAPRRVFEGETAARVAPKEEPTRPGYTFVGWYTSETGGYLYNFDEVVTSDIKLYASWIPAQTSYTVVYWQQSANDSQNAPDSQKTYDYLGQETRAGTTGSLVYTTAYDRVTKVPNGFQLNNRRTEYSKVVQPDGSTVLNVYYDRKLITMRFTFRDGTRKIFTGLYGTSLAANGYTWPRTNYAWSYYSDNGIGGMSYLGDFILPDTVAERTGTVIELFPGGGKTQEYRFFKQNIDGSYSNAPNDIGAGSNAQRFTFSEKYTGFKVAYAQRYYNSGSVYDLSAKSVASGQWVSLLDSYYGNYLNLAIWYERKSFKIHYLDPFTNQELSNFPEKSALYEENLSKYAPDTTTTKPVPSLPGYEWDGKWYKDQARTTEFDFNTKMPDHDVKVYAGWRNIKYKVTIEPDGGALSAGESTYFNVNYGEKISEYYDISRDYVEDSDGAYYYRYDTRANATAVIETQRYARYTTDPTEPNVDTSKKYRFEKDAYKLVGWYYVNKDGTVRPYDFSGSVTTDITLRAIWRRVGEYHIKYSDDAVGLDGKPVLKDGAQVKTSESPVDTNSYDDQSQSALLSRPQIPEGYRFRGWWYNGKLYNPYDYIPVLSKLANTNKDIMIYPALIPIEAITLEDTFIKFNGNGGKRIGESGVEVEETQLSHLELNTKMNVPDTTYFVREGYDLVGWNTDKIQANLRVVQFQPNEEIGVDNQANVSNTLYAVWKPKKYTVTISKKVIGVESDKNKDFTFDPSDSLQAENFFLQDGQSKAFTVEYGTTISIDEQVYADFNVAETITEKNLADHSADKTYPANNTPSLVVKGDVDIVFTNTRNKQKLRVQKVDIENFNNTLSGAIFDVYTIDENGNRSATPSYENITSDGNGYLVGKSTNYLSIPVGKYAIVEKKAPDGYLLPQEAMTLQVTSTSVSFLQNGNAAAVTTATLEDGEIFFQYKITNSKGTELPSTGGMGEHIYLILGLLLVLPASYILYKRKT